MLGLNLKSVQVLHQESREKLLEKAVHVEQKTRDFDFLLFVLQVDGGTGLKEPDKKEGRLVRSCQSVSRSGTTARAAG